MGGSGKNLKRVESELIEEYSWIVWAVVSRIINAGFTFFMVSDHREELEAVGNLALCYAAASYKKSRGIKFSTYAYTCVNNAVLLEIKKEVPYQFGKVDEELGQYEINEVDEMEWLLQSIIATQIVDRANLNQEETIVFVGSVFEENTLKELAGFLGVSESWASQLKKRAAGKIREIMILEGKTPF